MKNSLQNLQAVAMNRIQKIHFVGIGGAGMCGIAEILFRQGYTITGSDPAQNDMTEYLAGLGIAIQEAHHASHVTDVDVVVTSSAISTDNVEVLEAHRRLIPVIPRAQMLAELMRFRYGIAVAGSHGKTTTTSILAWILEGIGCDPTCIIGGKLNHIGSHACLGRGHILLAEADESDASFLFFHPMIALVTNLDADHLHTYHGDFTKMQAAFLEFLHRLPFYGHAIVGIDDANIQAISEKINRPLLTFGFSEGADIRATNYHQMGQISHFNVCHEGREFPAEFNLPGRHNVQNVLASLAVAHVLDIPMEKAIHSLGNFRGVNRRFCVSALSGALGSELTMVDDYGHHPSEIKATVESIRAGWPGQRIVMVFQPHRYTRLRDLFNEFVEVLSLADLLILLPVYSAGEKPIENVNAESLYAEIKARGRIRPLFVQQVTQLENSLSEILGADDILLMQGAGDIGCIAKEFAKRWSAPTVKAS